MNLWQTHRAGLLAAVWMLAAGCALAQDHRSLLAPARDAAMLRRAIEAERPGFTPPSGVTGVTVPHHLVAPDLIARGLWAATGTRYERIVLIAPDHYHATEGRFATTHSDFDTVFGTLRTDRDAVDRLLAAPYPFALLDDAHREHGWHVLTPFLRHFWPDVELIPVLAPIDAGPDDWASAAQKLLPLLDTQTLVVQSTDYSHFLPRAVAVARDQESITAVVSGDASQVLALSQPAHLDSKAAQFVQMTLQRALGAQPVIIANRNSAEYAPPANHTTSYVVTVYTRDAAGASVLRYGDQRVLYFAGDLLLGRHLTPALQRSDRALANFGAAIRAITAGAPLVANLEGVVLGEIPSGVPPDAHLMLSPLVLPLLERFGIRAVSLANNHSHDLGPGGRRHTEDVLGERGVAVLRHGEALEVGGVAVVALGFILNSHASNPVIRSVDELDAVCTLDAPPPLIAFVHWGHEYTTRAEPRQVEAAIRLAACGVSLVVGAHSHRASAQVVPAGGATQMVYSLGNFLFDQRVARGSGALLEVRVFAQGTLASRLIPIPNIFEALSQGPAHGAHRAPGG